MTSCGEGREGRIYEGGGMCFIPSTGAIIMPINNVANPGPAPSLPPPAHYDGGEDGGGSHHHHPHLLSASGVAARLFSRFCRDVSVDEGQTELSYAKMVVLSQKNVSTQEAFTQLFSEGERFVDWERADFRGKWYADSLAWVHVLRFVGCGADVGPAWKALLREHASLRHFEGCVQGAGLIPADRYSVSELIPLYLLMHVRHIQTLHAIRLFCVERYRTDVHNASMAFLSAMADLQFDHKAHTGVLVDVWRRCVRLELEAVRQELELVRLKGEEMQAMMRQRTLEMRVGRPRLRSRQASSSSSSQLGEEELTVFSMDRLKHWTSLIRFSNVYSMRQRRRLYFVMAQARVASPTDYLRRFGVANEELCGILGRYPVKSPEPSVLYEVISEMCIVSEPFPGMHQFRLRCFDGFSMEHKHRLRLNDLLHLYVAAYQAPSAWKEVWKLVFPVLSIQIIRDVEAFVSGSPFDFTAVMGILFGVGQRAGGGERGGYALGGHGVGGEAHDRADRVGQDEGVRVEAVEEWAQIARPLEHHAGAGHEPVRADALVALDGGRAALGLAGEAGEVLHEDAGDAVLHEEVAGQDGAHGAILAVEGAARVGHEAEVDGVHVHEGGLVGLDQEDWF